jgi:hypothetical protein
MFPARRKSSAKHSRDLFPTSRTQRFWVLRLLILGPLSSGVYAETAQCLQISKEEKTKAGSPNGENASGVQRCSTNRAVAGQRRGRDVLRHAGVQGRRRAVRADASGWRIAGRSDGFRTARGVDGFRSENLLHHRSLPQLRVGIGEPIARSSRCFA